ncbi:MAG: tetratricopeptide repeat protein [Nibricoccus sp.]
MKNEHTAPATVGLGGTEGATSWARAPFWLAALALIVAAFVAYQPVWHAGYIWDDDVMLTGNRHVQSPDGLRAIWFSTELPDYFPLTSTALWLQWRCWGANPLGYHLANVLLHAFSAVLWWRVLARLAIPGAWLAAAFFVLHPANVESVAWITEIKNTLAMLFYALTLLAYLRFEDTQRARWLGFALGAFVCGLLSKTAVAPLPVVLLGFAWWRRGRVDWRDLWRSAPFFALSALFALVTIWFHHHRALGGMVVRDDDFFARLAGAGWAIWFYLYKAVLPLDLVFVYPRWKIDGAAVWSHVPWLLALAALAVCWCCRQRWGKAWLFALGYFVALLLPVLGFLNISYMRHSFVADRWQYFAVIGPIALIAAGLTRIITWRPVVGAGIASLLLVTLGALTWRQSRMYVDVGTLWETTAARNPASAVAQSEIGNSLLERGAVDEAIARYERALALQPDYGLAHHNYGCALLKKNQPDAAVERFLRALSCHPGLHPARYYLGRTLLQLGRAEEAAIELEKGLAEQPNSPELHYHLGNARLQQGRLDGAIAHFRKVVALDPGSAQGLNDLGVALIRKGQPDEALGVFERALKLDPDLAEAHNNVGRMLQQKGRLREAIAHYRAALKLQPEDPDTLTNLAWVLATSSDASIRNGLQALVLAQRANQQAGRQNPLVLRTLAAAYAENGRFLEARGSAEQALGLFDHRIDGGLAEALRSDLSFYASGAPLREMIQP